MASSEFDKAKGSSLEKNLSLETHLRKRAEVLDTLVPNKKRMPQASWLDSVPVSGDPLGENAFSQGHMDDRSPDFERDRRLQSVGKACSLLCCVISLWP